MYFNSPNNDGTTTGKGTTHDTNFTIFQPILKGEAVTPQRITRSNQDEDLSLAADIDEKTEIPHYSIGQRKPPPLFPNFVDNKNTDELEKSLQRDLVWAIMIGVDDPDNESDLIGSWTDFKLVEIFDAQR